jgi:hypothetical protein
MNSNFSNQNPRDNLKHYANRAINYMTIKSFLNRFSKKQIWYLATVGGFIIGWIFGWLIMSGITSRSAIHLATFWAYPAVGAGLGMGLCQWRVALRSRKYGYLWIPVTTVGFTASVGATLTLLLAASTYASGIYDFAYAGLVALFTPIAPFSLLIGPICQWFLVRDISINEPYKELIKFIAGWVISTFLVFGMLYLFLEISDNVSTTNDLNWIIGFLVLIVITIPSGLVFARTTINTIRVN